MGDAVVWSECRVRNESWLAPWEGRPPGTAAGSWSQRHSPAAFTAMRRVLRRESRAGRSLPYAVTLEGRLVGQVTVANIVRGAFLSGSIGYWVDGAVAGRGITTTAVALVVDHCFGPVGLHRVEANIRPENHKSLRVVQKLGFRQEGLHPRLLFIDGQWRDHASFALTVEDLAGERLLRRLPGDN